MYMIDIKESWSGPGKKDEKIKEFLPKLFLAVVNLK